MISLLPIGKTKDLLLDELVANYEASIHPETIQTTHVIDALKGNGLMSNFIGFEEYSDLKSSTSGLTEGEPIMIGGEATIQYDDEKKNTKTKKIVVAAQNGKLLSPESLVYANKLYKRAEEKNLDLLLIANTEGGGAQTREALMGQSTLISNNISTLLNLKTQIVSVVLRKGGSGGALSNQVADQKLMLERAFYYVIAPPHCSSIKWRTDEHIGSALRVLKATAYDLLEQGVINQVIKEYPGGANLEKDAGYMSTLKSINDSLLKEFLQFEKRRHSITSRFSELKTTENQLMNKTIETRLQKSQDYAKMVSGYEKIISKLKSKTHRKSIIERGKLAVRDITDEKDELELIKDPVAYFYGTERQKATEATLKKYGDNGNEFVRCGEYVDKKTGNIKHNANPIIEVNEVELAILRTKFQKGKLNEKEYLEERINALKKTSVTECKAEIPFPVFQDYYHSCPDCGWGPPLNAREWINLLTDGNYTELDSFQNGLDFTKFVKTMYHTAEPSVNMKGEKAYLDLIKEYQEETGLFSAMLPVVGKIHDNNSVICAMDFSFIGGTLGMAEAKYFAKASQYAIKKNLPLVLVSSSGGARMEEGMLALQAMVSVNASVSYLKQNKTPYFVILANPTFGGTPASFASLGDITIAEKGLRYGFAGPRVVENAMKSAAKKQNMPQEVVDQIKIPEFQMRPDVLKHVYIDNKPMIHHVLYRPQIADTLRQYIEITNTKK